MKTLVISDTHLSLPFDEKKYLLLKRIISDADKVIINGDFWEGFLLTFDEFFSSQWSKLFSLLKEKKAIYIFGNHDAREYNDLERIKEFSVLHAERYSFQENGKTYTFEHGHSLFPTEKKPVNISDPRFRRTVARNDAIERKCIQYAGRSYQYLIRHINSIVKRKVSKKLAINEFFFCGHTHIHEINHKKRFYNTGIIKHGLAQYIYIDKGSIIPIQERY